MRAFEYAKEKDLIALKFTSGRVGIADESFKALAYYGAAPTMAEELDRSDEMWLDNT